MLTFLVLKTNFLHSTVLSAFSFSTPKMNFLCSRGHSARLHFQVLNISSHKLLIKSFKWNLTSTRILHKFLLQPPTTLFWWIGWNWQHWSKKSCSKKTWNWAWNWPCRHRTIGVQASDQDTLWGTIKYKVGWTWNRLHLVPQEGHTCQTQLERSRSSNLCINWKFFVFPSRIDQEGDQVYSLVWPNFE